MPSKHIPSDSGYCHLRHPDKKTPPTGTHPDLNLAMLTGPFHDEDKARAFLESKRWPDCPVCPHCDPREVYKLTAKPESKSPVRRGVYKCKACREQFTVRIGTVFEESHLPLAKRLMALHPMTSRKKGISARQMARELEVTPKTAWFQCHRIRRATRDGAAVALLTGSVEIDETHVGGKPRKKGVGKRCRGTEWRPVLVLVERGGSARALPIENVSRESLHREALTQVARKAAVSTDDLPGYNGLGERFDGGHHKVSHSRGEYIEVDENGVLASTTTESFFVILKRAGYGIHHQMSKRHLHCHVDERRLMWDRRKESDGERMADALKGAERKRLLYG